MRKLKTKYKQAGKKEAEVSEEPAMAVKITEISKDIGPLFGTPVEKPEVKKEEPEEEEETSLLFRERKKISIKDLATIRGVRVIQKEKADISALTAKYPLTPSTPKEGEKIYAWAEIRWNEKAGALIFSVMEPPLTEDDQRELKRIKGIVEEKIDVSFEAFQKEAAIKYLKKSLNEIITQFDMKISPEKTEVYEYYIFRDFIGLDKIQPIMNDNNIEDISCDGVGVPIFIYHRNPKIGSIRTNVVFETKEEMDDFVIKLSQRCKKSVSVAEPLLEGALPDGSRVHATLGTDIARRGSNFTIRKFTTEPLTPIHMLNFGTMDTKMLAYLWFIIEHNSSVLVAGPTASGKTSLLNALSLFIRPALKVVSIEDTPELRLPHLHWVPEVARTGFGVTTSGLKIGEVNMFDLLKGSLRQRPDYIIVGEVRGKETFVLFQQIATGHPGLATLHADSVDKIIDRLTTPPINLPSSLLENLNAILFIKNFRYHDTYVRKVTDVHEVVGYDPKTKRIITGKTFMWDSATNKFEPHKDSVLLAKIAETFGINENQLKMELLDRIKVLKWMQEKKITYYKDVGRIISMYYTSKERLMEAIGR